MISVFGVAFLPPHLDHSLDIEPPPLPLPVCVRFGNPFLSNVSASFSACFTNEPDHKPFVDTLSHSSGVSFDGSLPFLVLCATVIIASQSSPDGDGSLPILPLPNDTLTFVLSFTHCFVSASFSLTLIPPSLPPARGTTSVCDLTYLSIFFSSFLSNLVGKESISSGVSSGMLNASSDKIRFWNNTLSFF